MNPARAALIAAFTVAVAFAARWTNDQIAIAFFGYSEAHVISATLAGKIIISLMFLGFIVWGVIALMDKVPPLPFVAVMGIFGVLQLRRLFGLWFDLGALAFESVANIVLFLAGAFALGVTIWDAMRSNPSESE